MVHFNLRAGFKLLCHDSDFSSAPIFIKQTKMIYRMVYPLVLNFVMSCVAFLVALKLISGMKSLFAKAGLSGKDMNKKDHKEMM